MKNGLRQKLNDYIKAQNGAIVSHDTIKQLCKTWGYRESNAERRLRASESPNIERVMKNGAIIGYRYNNKSFDLVDKAINPDTFIKDTQNLRNKHPELKNPDWWRDPSIDPRLEEKVTPRGLF